DFLDNLFIALMGAGKYRVIDRNNLDLLLQEQKFSQSDLFDPSHMKEFGKLSGVDAFLYGDIRLVYGRYTLSLKLLNVTTARAIWATELAISAGEKSPLELAVEGAVAATIDSLRAAAPTLTKTQTVSVWKILKDNNPDIIAMDKLNITLIQGNIFKVVDRENLESLLTEQKLSLTGLVDPNKIKELGQIYGVDAFIFGSERTEAGKTVLALQMIDVNTATVIWGEEAGKGGTAATPGAEPTEPLDKIAYAATNALGQAQGLKVNTIAIGNLIGAPPELSEKLSIRLTQSGRFKVIDRSKLELILKEQKLSLTGIIAPEKMKELGKLYGIDAFIFGRKVEGYSEMPIVVLKLIDVKTGVILWGDTFGDTNDELVKAAQQVTRFGTANLRTERPIRTLVLWRMEGGLDMEGLMDVMAAELTKQGRFRVVDRQNLETLVKEQQFTQSGLVNPATMKEFGKLYGIDALLYGSAFEGLALKLVDASTATLLWAEWVELYKWFAPVLTSHKQFTNVVIENLLKPNPNLSAVNTIAIWQIVDETGGNAHPLELSDILGERVLKETQYKLVDRDTLEAILKEQKMSSEGVIDPASRQRVKLLGIDAYLFGRLSKGDEKTRTLVLKLLSVDTGELLWINKSSAEWLFQPEGMVLIPEGWFLMGSPEVKGYPDDEHPQHKVWVDAFWIDRCEVTNAQYEKFMKATGHRAPKFWNDDKFNKPDHPVVCVSWGDAVAYAQWAGKRLPTEAEWEKAARGRLVGKLYPWGNSISHDNANIMGTGGRDRWKDTSPVGSFPPNGYGLYDMAGNVQEWCADWYDDDYYSRSPERNPKGPEERQRSHIIDEFFWQVFRGGDDGYNSRGRYYGGRVADRDSDVPSIFISNSPYSAPGFRCAKDVTP
ncbi:SUMF1/EgtB/PvdO family nonheme iron enzyme, partial [Candidatus Poribacteria bacterium]|nr:SUMF1/EgtB/PvdO family nonheme iron enzyme [Candidatus Poribacteria bacterium]